MSTSKTNQMYKIAATHVPPGLLLCKVLQQASCMRWIWGCSGHMVRWVQISQTLSADSAETLQAGRVSMIVEVHPVTASA